MITARRAIPPSRRRAFTLVELLVAVSVLVLLIGILIPTVGLVVGNSRAAANQALLRTLADGAYAFNADFDYYPPLLTPDPDLLSRANAPDNTDSSRTATERAADLEDVRWHSVLTPMVYLLGLGVVAPEPADAVATAPWISDMSDPNYENRHDGAEGLGIRNPGPDRSWGGAVARENHRPTFAGRVYGPYIDPKIGESQVRPVRLEDFPYRAQLAPPLTQSEVDLMQTLIIVDRFDNPIRYYKNWPERDTTTAPTASGGRAATFVDAPMELIPHDELQTFAQADSEPDTLPAPEIAGRPCAFLSAGPNARWGERVREELPQTDLLIGRDIRMLNNTGANNEQQRVFDALRDNQVATPE